MTPEAAIYQWLNGFGIPAFPSSSVPSETAFPYMTYDLTLGEWLESETNMPVNVWYRTESEAKPNAKVREIRDAIGMGGVQLRCDDGTLWIKRGSPWAQAVNIEGEDEKIKRRYVNINIEFNIP
jgi:hypothetical protein